MIEQHTLSRLGFLVELPQRALGELAAVSRLLRCEPHTVIFHAGDRADTLYGVLEGEVELSLTIRDKSLAAEVEFEEAVHVRVMEKDSQIVVDAARPGHVFGWSALSGRGRHTVTATCSMPAQVVAIPAQNLKTLCEQDPSLGYAVMKRLVDIISKRLDNRNQRLIEVWVEAFGVSKVAP